MAAKRDALSRAALAIWAFVGLLIATWLVGRALLVLRPVLVSALLMMMFVVVLTPLVDRLDRRMPRAIATAIAYFAMIAFLYVIGRLLAPSIAKQFADLGSDLPDLSQDISNFAEKQLASIGLNVDIGVENWSSAISSDNLLQWVTGFASFAASWLLLLLIAPIAAFYLLVDLPRLQRTYPSMVPSEARTRFVGFVEDASKSVAAFIRGQIVVSVFVGVFTWIALLIIDVPFSGAIGLIAGASNLIPFIGPIVGGLVAVVVALANGGTGQAVAVLVAILIVQQVESQVLSPLVLGQAVHLRPLGVLIALIIGGLIAGLPGLLLAVPAVTVMRAAIQHFGSAPRDGLEPAD
jgi:predicted PurR-regulated permease PerM